MYKNQNTMALGNSKCVQFVKAPGEVGFGIVFDFGGVRILGSGITFEGLEGRVKQKVIKDLMLDQRMDLLAIQESKLEVVTESVCIGLWESDHCNYIYLPTIGHVDERREVNSSASSEMAIEINGFNSFVMDVDLCDVNPLGRKFMWYHASGLSMSRNYRVLISEGWMRCWGSAALWVLPRTISDHCPLVLKHGEHVSKVQSKWLKEGDENSKFFHRFVKARAVRNSLKAIKVEGVWVDTPSEVRKEVVEYFRK
ncbi:hypothetical protein MTR_0465s0020 [Medicago truncatula]|uniref:Endonuclease/exonuclease/phosphatase family protein n=1 Tax=Medicago truncatula TaxID=3880 RepID=A0A072TED4_MEDTR|nr:hypothetical protein MTR_0465s0020 [Medicago truncatula]